MTKLFEEYDHTYKKTVYQMIPVETIISERVTKVIGIKCDKCNHILKDTEQYYLFSMSQDYEDDSVDKDICIKCCEIEFKNYLLEDEYDNLDIRKRVNYLKE